MIFDKLISGEFASKLKYEFWPAESAASRKILLILHGRGDSAEGFHWLPEALSVEEFSFLFLDAPDPYGSGFSWYELAPRQGPGVLRSRALLFELLDRLQSEFKISSTDIFLFGFSQGCLMSLDVALRYPRSLGGVVGSSGYVFLMEEYPKSFSPALDSQRIFVSHGTEDDVLPYSKTKESIDRLVGLGVHIDWRSYDKAHTIDAFSEVPEIRAFLKRLLDLS